MILSTRVLFYSRFGILAFCNGALGCGPATAAAEELPRRVLQFVAAYKEERTGLSGATSLAMTRDGRHLYAAANFSKTLLLLHRDPESGRLTLHRTYQDPYIRPKISGALQLPVSTIPDLIVLSPDDMRLYVVGVGLSVYARDVETGEVTLVGVINHKPLWDVASLAFSPDGRNAYAVGAVNGTLATYARDPTTGMLTLAEVVQDDKSFSDEKYRIDSARVASTLASPKIVCISPDGRHVYVAASGDGTVTVLKRDQETGAVTEAQILRDVLKNGRIIPADRGLRDVRSLAISPDGQLVYTTNPQGRLSVFHRDEATGQLSWSMTFYDGVNVPEFGDPTLVHASPDNMHVYVACRKNRSIAVFRRDSKAPDALQFIQAIRDEQNGVDGISGVRAFASDELGKHIYTLSEEQVIAFFTVASPPLVEDAPASKDPLTPDEFRSLLLPSEAPTPR